MPTVRGPVAAAELGRTLPHEHVLILQPEALQNYGHVWGESYWDEDARVRDAIEKLRAVRDAGYRTLVDPTAPGLGRCIPRIQRISAEVDLNIVVASGVYAFVELPNFLHYRSAEAIAELFVRELREGIDDTGVRAAFIKCAVEEHGLVGDIPRILDAVAIAAIETGAPVMVHTNARAATGTLALDELTSRGVEPSRIVVAHAGDSNDLAVPAGDRATRARRSASTASTSPTSTRTTTGSGRCSRCSRRDTATASTSRTTPPASWTSWSATRTSPNERPDYLHLSTTDPARAA